MDSDSDNDFVSERAIRKKLAKLVRLSRRNPAAAPQSDLQDAAVVPPDFYRTNGLDCDAEVTIKVVFPQDCCESVHRLTVRRSDCFITVFKQLADLKTVPFDFVELVLMPQNRDVSQYDCLDSLHYDSPNYFHACIRRSPRLMSNSRGTGNIEVKCVYLNNVLVYRMYEDQPLDILISYCARDLGCDKAALRLIYEDQPVWPFQSCSVLDIISGQTIQVRLIS